MQTATQMFRSNLLFHFYLCSSEVLEVSLITKLFCFAEKYIQQTLGRNKTNEYTKMVKAIGKRRKSALENDPIRQKMLQERQEHAKRQDHDYSHVFRYGI